MNNSSIKIHPISSDDTGPMKKEVGQLALDIYHTDTHIVIQAPIAGVAQDDITLTINEDVLVIKGHRTQKEEVPEEKYYTKECFWGDFSRSVVLPLEADSKNVSASFEKGILEIRIGKKEKSTGPQIIKIKS